MRRFLISLAMISATGAATHGCTHDCVDNRTCTEVPVGAGGAGGSMSAGGGAGGSATGCDPSLEKNAVGNGCGVFVSASKGDDALGDGTKEKPFKSIGKAASAKKAIYLCGESFSESVTLPSGIALYGALACASDWHYDAGKKTTLTADADKIPLTLTKGDGESPIADLAITSKDATKAGGSSIAVLAVEAKATLKRVELTAGKGAAGADAPADMADPANDGDKGKSPATPGCTTTMGVIGGGGGQKTCQGSVIVNGGLGGSGTMAAGGPGANGDALVLGDGLGGAGGKGQGATSCDNGKDGAKGSPGMPGNGSKGLGKLDSSGYAGGAGDPGASAGTPGQGGGGGGGNGKNACSSAKDGPAGGGGGSGGCGGKPGTGGGAAGASLALASVTGTLTLVDVKLTSGDGGSGGKGSSGQPGGQGKGGGQGAAGDNNNACQGGTGGAGGLGGAGGGGLGGHSIGIAYTGMAPAMMTNVTVTVGKAGTGGAGGDGGAGNQGGKGDDGVSEKVKGFDGK